MQFTLALLSALGLAAASPVAEIVRRAPPNTSGNFVNLCVDNACTDCRSQANIDNAPYGTCLNAVYEDMAPQGFTINDQGDLEVYVRYFDPAQLGDNTCRIITGLSTGADQDICGQTAVVTNAPGCNLITVSDTITFTQCCGDQCNTISQRDLLSTRQDGDVRFTQQGNEFTRSGVTQRVGADYTCAGVDSCTITTDRTVENSFSISASVSVGDPLGIVNVSLGTEFSQSESTSMGFMASLNPGQTGFLAFTPLLTCVTGTFDGDCDGCGQVVDVCSPQPDSNDGTVGTFAAVVLS